MASKAKISEAASLMGRRSVTARIAKWGEAGFQRKMRTWGKMGGRPRGNGKNQTMKGGR